MPKRKIEQVDSDVEYSDAAPVRKTKAARATGKTAASATASTSAPATKAVSSWKEIPLEGEGEDEDGVRVYDMPGEIRRKIRLLQKEPDFKITHWLRDIGGINSNSYRRFMAEKDAKMGKGNGTYGAAYVYFEKRRIFEKKKKTATRERNEIEYPYGIPLEDPRGHWVVVGR